MTKLLEFIEIETGENIEYSIIWLHGLGASGHDFEPIVPELKLLARPGVRFLFPHAPIRPITVNNGAAMRGWYDITSLNFESREQDDVGLAESVASVDELITHEIERGISESNIVLAGFSQGGAVALQAGLTLDRKIAGVIGLSTYLPMNAEAMSQVSAEKMATPIFLAHGTQDEVIRFPVAEQSRDKLMARDAAIEWHEYEIAHSVSNEEVDDLSVWLRRMFGM